MPRAPTTRHTPPGSRLRVQADARPSDGGDDTADGTAGSTGGTSTSTANAAALDDLVAELRRAPAFGGSRDAQAPDAGSSADTNDDEDAEDDDNDDEEGVQASFAWADDDEAGLDMAVGVPVVLDESFTSSLEVFEEIVAQGRGAQLTYDDVARIFPYPLDSFQREAAEASMRGDSVVVCAPTGAGKTAIAVAAAVPVLAAGKRVIYTTPLKALSNQKLFELQAIFGPERVGLRTGDVSVNPGAPVMIMTTEILRNISYRVLLEADAESSGFTQNLDDVALTVLDEVHYLGHRDRGSVWEEIIINCPPHVRLLAMSATVANPGEVGAWIEAVHGRCATVQTGFRPVPLKWWFAWDEEGAERMGSNLAPLLKPPEPGRRQAARINPALDPSAKAVRKVTARLERLSRKLTTATDWQANDALYAEIAELEDRLHALESGGAAAALEPAFAHLVRTLDLAELLPAIYFVFSRKRCNEYALAVPEGLVGPAERAAILRELNDLRASQPEAIPKALEAPLLKGVASHHAGLLPGWKGLVESLYQQGLIKVVFATETLAAGINMPARTTVISALSRRRDGYYVPLLHNELLQMAGRAGRRGYDTQGHCVITQTRFDGARDAVEIIAKGPENVESQFTISYGMVLNLLSTRSLPACQAFLDRSFLRFQATAGAEAALGEAQRLESRAADLLERIGQSASDDEALLKRLEAAKTALQVERSSMRAVRKQALQVRACEVAARLCLPADEAGRLASFQAAMSSADAIDPGAAAPAANDADGDGDRGWADGVSPPGAPTSSPPAAATAPDAAPLPGEHTCALVSLDLGNDGLLNTDVRTALCLGPVSDLARDMDYAAYLDLDTAMKTFQLYQEPSLLACLAADNNLYLLEARHVAAVHNGPDAVAAFLGDQSMADVATSVSRAFADAVVNRWTATHLGIQSTAGSALSANLALRLTLVDVPASDNVLLETGWPEAVGDAQARVKACRTQYRALKKEAQQVTARQVRDGSARARAGTAAEAAQLKKQARKIRASLRTDKSADWRDIVGTVAVLVEFGALAEARPGAAGWEDWSSAELQGWYEVSALGRVARDIRFENELWLALILQSKALQDIKPSTLAGLMCAMVTPFQNARPDTVTTLEPSEELKLLVESLSEAATALALAQARQGIASPIQVDLRLAGVVEAWAWNVQWEALKEACNLDDGDIARLLGRVADLLRQIGAADSVAEKLRGTARAAYQRIYRQPICDLLGL